MLISALICKIYYHADLCLVLWLYLMDFGILDSVLPFDLMTHKFYRFFFRSCFVVPGFFSVLQRCKPVWDCYLIMFHNFCIVGFLTLNRCIWNFFVTHLISDGLSLTPATTSITVSFPERLYIRYTSEPSAACEDVISLIVSFPSGDVQVCLGMFQCGNISALTIRFFILPIVGLKMSSIPSFTSDCLVRIFFWGLEKW